jgi:hAT family C-terminal dimerisation region
VRKKVRDTFVYNDPLNWWMEHQGQFPILVRLARYYLAVQATSAPSERIFSVASRVIADRQARLDPNIAGKALYVSENWKWCGEQINLIDVIPDEDVLNE